MKDLGGLQDDLAKWANEGKTYSLTKQFDRETGEWVVGIDPKEVPVWVGPAIGVCVYSLRSGLDHLAYELALAFIGGIDPGAQAVIQALQPYHRGNDYRSHPLWLVNELSNIDKHRTVHTALFMSRGVTVSGGAGFDSLTIHNVDGPFKGYAELARYRPRDPKVEVKLDFTIEVAFGQGTPLPDRPVTDTLMGLFGYIVQEVLVPLNPYLPDMLFPTIDTFMAISPLRR